MATIKSLLKRKQIEAIDRDPEGYMVYLRNGFSHDGEQHCFGADSLAEISRELLRVIPCNCDECQRGEIKWAQQ